LPGLSSLRPLRRFEAIMRSLSALFALIVIVPFFHPTHAADKPGETQPVSVEALVAQLGDKNFRVRQAAGKALEERGEQALPELRKAISNPDEEVSRRVEVLLQKVEKAALLTPRRVTLQMKNALVADIFKDLTRQTGYKLQFQGNQQRRMSIDLADVTYWQAMEKITNDIGLSAGYDDQQGIIYLYEQNAHSPYTCHVGPFRFVATNFSYNRYINLANIPRNGIDPNQQYDNNLNFGFMIQAEPKTPLLAVSPPRLSKAEDENGVSLLPRLHANEQQFHVHYYEGNGLHRNFQHSAGTQLAKPAKEATRAKIIKGRVTITLLSGTKPEIVFDNLAVGKKKISVVGQTAEIIIDEIVEQNKLYTLTMTVKRIVKNGEQDYNWINGVAQKMELQDAKGRKYSSQGITNYLNNTPTSIHATFQFGMPPNTDLGPAVKFVFNQWVTMSHELEFEFKDLPLP
jgi:hypothetical protein